MIIGGAVVTNGNSASCDLVIENKTPILRQKDILTEEKADSPCRRIYYAIQLMYIDEAQPGHVSQGLLGPGEGRGPRGTEHGCA